MKTGVGLLLIGLTFGSIAFAGIKEGGGGGAYVCRNPDNSIKSVQLVDLWEATETLGMSIQYDDITSPEDQVATAISRLGTYFPAIRRQLSAVQLKVVQAKPDVKWPAPDDVKNKFSDAGCPLEGMMYYNDIANRLVVNPQLFNFMVAHGTKTDVAASYFHEILYKVLRQGGATNSVFARYVNGAIFSTDPVGNLNLSPPTLPTNVPVWLCSLPALRSKAAAISFYIYDPNGAFTGKTPYPRVFLKSYGDADFLKETVWSRAEGNYGDGDFIIFLLQTGILGGLSPLGNPIGTDTTLDLRAISYNPLTVVRTNDPAKRAVRCQLVN
jgi:hypothetical protein